MLQVKWENVIIQRVNKGERDARKPTESGSG